MLLQNKIPIKEKSFLNEEVFCDIFIRMDFGGSNDSDFHLALKICLSVLLEEGMAAHSIFLPGESHGQRSLVGYSPGVCKDSDMVAHAHVYV